MTEPRTTITHVDPLSGHWLRLSFAEGEVHDVDVSEVLATGGVFAAIRDNREVLEAIRVDPEFGTIEWPAGVDIDPDVLRGDQPPASGVRLPRRVVQAA